MDHRLGLSNQRPAPRVEVPRGFEPNLPGSLTLSLPVAADVTIKSGQALQNLGGEWVLANNTRDTKVYIAHYDSTDPSVQESGVLMAYDTAGSFRIETPYFTGDTFVGGNALTVSATAGSLAVVAAPNNPAANELVVGHVTVSGLRDVSSENTNVDPSSATRFVIVFDTGHRSPIA